LKTFKNRNSEAVTLIKLENRIFRISHLLYAVNVDLYYIGSDE